MKKSQEDIIVIDFEGSYCQKGEHCFKLVLNKKVFKDSQCVDIDLISPENDRLEIDVKKWGRKINCCFTIEDEWTDGVYLVKISYEKDNEKKQKYLECWIVR